MSDSLDSVVKMKQGVWKMLKEEHSILNLSDSLSISRPRMIRLVQVLTGLHSMLMTSSVFYDAKNDTDTGLMGSLTQINTKDLAMVMLNLALTIPFNIMAAVLLSSQNVLNVHCIA